MISAREKEHLATNALVQITLHIKQTVSFYVKNERFQPMVFERHTTNAYVDVEKQPPYKLNVVPAQRVVVTIMFVFNGSGGRSHQAQLPVSPTSGG